MKKKAEFPMHLLNNRMNDINKKYVDEYIEFMKQQSKNRSSIDSYSIAYDRVFRFKENWNIDFRDYTDSIFDTFVIALLEYEMSDDRINFITSAISTLAEFVKDRYPDKFGRNFLKGLERLEADETKNIPSRALSQIELNLVKELIKRERLKKLEYIFTVLYYTDVQKSDFKIYNPMCANYETGYFELDGKIEKITDRIQQVLDKVKGVKITPAMILYHFRIIAHYLHSKGFYEEGKPFTFDDIKKTRDKYFLKCPCCERSFENTAENWVLVQYDFSEQKVLVCKDCKGVVQK